MLIFLILHAPNSIAAFLTRLYTNLTLHALADSHQWGAAECCRHDHVIVTVRVAVSSVPAVPVRRPSSPAAVGHLGHLGHLRHHLLLSRHGAGLHESHAGEDGLAPQQPRLERTYGREREREAWGRSVVNTFQEHSAGLRCVKA